MRRVIIIIYLLLSAGYVSSQSYTEFPETKGFWKIEDSDCGGCWSQYSQSCLCGYHQYILEGDTTIGLYTYKKIKEGTSWYTFLPNPPYQIITYTFYPYIGCIRNDSLNKKVFFVEKNSLVDTLLYDFNLSIGDTLPISYVYSGNPVMTVSAIDSINTNGKYYKRFKFQGGGWTNEYLIEGIGSTFGPLESIKLFFEDVDILRCFKDNDSIINHGSPIFDDWCDVFTGIDELLSSAISIHPNPTTGDLSINLNEPFRGSLRVLNSLGQVVLEEEFKATRKLNIS